jgi:hypothetical protein
MTMSDKIPMFPTPHPPRADEDTATIEQVMEQVPGEIELDKIVKAQTSGPQIVLVACWHTSSLATGHTRQDRRNGSNRAGTITSSSKYGAGP